MVLTLSLIGAYPHMSTTCKSKGMYLFARNRVVAPVNLRFQNRFTSRSRVIAYSKNNRAERTLLDERPH